MISVDITWAIQLSYFWIIDPQNLWDKVKQYCFKLLSFGAVSYIEIDNWMTYIKILNNS